MPDAQRFLVVKAAEEEARAPLTLVVNWTAELERRRTEGVKSPGIVIHVWHFVIMLCSLFDTISRFQLGHDVRFSQGFLPESL